MSFLRVDSAANELLARSGCGFFFRTHVLTLVPQSLWINGQPGVESPAPGLSVSQGPVSEGVSVLLPDVSSVSASLGTAASMVTALSAPRLKCLQKLNFI